MDLSTQFILPLQRLETLQDKQQISGDTTSVNNSFTNIFENAIENVKTTQNELDLQQYLLATGEVDDPHNVTIAAANAQLSVDLLVQIRNHAVEAYNELVKTSI